MKNDLINTLYRDDDSNKTKGHNSKNGNNDRDKKIDDALDKVLYCLQPSIRSNITVFNLNSENDLSDTIFGSICKCKLICLNYFNIY
jgi:hypothetical protein